MSVELVPGRAADLLVAERLGFAFVNAEHAAGEPGALAKLLVEHERYPAVLSLHEHGPLYLFESPAASGRAWSPSFDMSAATGLMTELNRRGLYVMLCTPTPGNVNWECRGWNPNTNTNRFIAYGPSPMLAIVAAFMGATSPVVLL